MVSPHHKILAKTLDKVLSGKIKRLIINMPPGYTKTELAVINFIAHGLAINPASKFIHISYSDALVMNNSSAIKEVVLSKEFQTLWPQRLRTDTQAKKSWYNSSGGGMLAVSSAGAITGFRAGRMQEGFSGALVVDDPIKPDDAYSEIIRSKVNNRFTNTFKSRIAHEDIPIIVIMQRIHELDPTGFLLKGGTGEKWHHLLLPAEIKKRKRGEKYFLEYGGWGKELPHNLEYGALWPYKHTLEQLEIIKSSDAYTYASQYDQRPAPIGGGIFKEEWWEYYDVEPVCEYRFITGDTAQKTEEHNDYSVFQLWGFKEKNLYLLDQIRGKWEAPNLKRQLVALWNKHIGTGIQTVGRLRAVYIEDKASGTGLIQDVKSEYPIPIFPIPRHKDKVSRAMDCAPYIANGYVRLPSNAAWLSEYLSEFGKFTPVMSHAHDDQVDATLDAIAIGFQQNLKTAGTW